MPGDRPEDRITVEEHRILRAAVSGPRRVQLTQFKPFTLIPNTGQVIAKNGSAPALYIEIRLISGPGIIFIGPSNQLSIQNAKRVDLTLEYVVGTVLLRGEEIWVSGTTAGQVPTIIQVGEIQP